MAGEGQRTSGTPVLDGVLILASIHYVLKAEQLLRAAGIAHDVVPVPRRISGDCGMAITVASADLAAIRTVLRAAAIIVARFYRREPSGGYTFTPLDENES